METRLSDPSTQAVPPLPGAASVLAQRLGATGGPWLSGVSLAQSGTMRGSPGARPLRFSAAQSIDLRRCAFSWRANVGPLGCVSVVDALEGSEPRLDLRLLRVIPLGSATASPALTKGEIMRYLAELAWAPDAILLNPELDWQELDGRSLRVGAGQGAARGEVTLRLDAQGRIVEARAEDRPREEEEGFVERPWRGRFGDYRQHEGRWIPFAAEVDWVIEGRPFTTWSGVLRSWEIA
ncbi:hypothetical protein E0493_07920 [Roseomonas sp. M0104]|uniref:Uncharacterized protein n=1 Tax=Teichococcus coralli TaxID=2545983 RepID=A0A845B9M1_9PROT|nr:DUF6544 family protein [Pseudoroseomonas coralli]MXP63278.1 hypothetical protein [Pseudoroseomonas coralli]